MKKSLLILALITLVALPSHGSVVSIQSDSYISNDNESVYTMDTMWAKNGKYEEKVIDIGSKLLYDNNINKRVPFMVGRDKNINADSASWNKVVTVHQGIFPYIDSDDELAYIVAHEISHSLDSYGGIPTWIAYRFNSKHYESKSDLMAIDMMVKSGYNPVAAITCANKFFPEDQWDFGLSHPKTTKRLLAMYKYIKVKYPQSLTAQATSNVHFVNFKRVMDRDIKEFNQKRAEKEYKKQKHQEDEKNRV